MARDQATLENARVDLIRYQNLIQQGAVTKQQLDTQVATVRQDEGIVKIRSGRHRKRQASDHVLPYHGAAYPAASACAAVDAGNLVQAAGTTALATITQLQPIAMIFNMPEDNLPEVQKAMRAKGVLAAEAWDRDLQTRIASGRLLTLDNQIDQTTGTVRVKLEFANRDNTLFPEPVRQRQAASRREAQRGHPAQYRHPAQLSQTFAYVIKPDNTVEVRNIQTGASEDDQIEIVKRRKARRTLA